jgi:hypothetical protein
MLLFRFSQDLNESTTVEQKWGTFNYWATQIPNKYMDEANVKKKGGVARKQKKIK